MALTRFGRFWAPAVWLWCSILLAIASGCAQVQVTRLEKPTDYKTGVRFYRPRPYLWVTDAKEEATGDKFRKVTIIWLPDLTEEYVATWQTGLGTVNAQLTIQDGWNLVGLTGQADSKTAEIITAISGLVPSITGMRIFRNAEKKEGEEELPLGLWKIDIQSDGSMKLSRAWYY